MKSTPHITIANPCHEDWDAMTPAQQGRHCGGFQKTVIDFTLITSTRLAAIVMLLLCAVSVVWSQPTSQQATKYTIGPKQLREIRGRVRDVHNATMAGITVNVKGIPVSAVTDDAGDFTLLLPDTLRAPILFLVAEMNGHAIGGETVDVKDALHGNVVLHLYSNMHITTSATGKSDLIRTIGGSLPTDLVALTPGIYQQKRGVVAPSETSNTPYIVSHGKHTFWQRMTKLIRKKHKPHEAK